MGLLWELNEKNNVALLAGIQHILGPQKLLVHLGSNSKFHFFCS